MVASSETRESEPEATLLDALEQDLVGSPEVPATQVEDGPHCRRGESAVREYLTLVDSSDDDAPFVVSAAPARRSRRLVLVPESVDATPQSTRTVSGLNRQYKSCEICCDSSRNRTREGGQSG